MKIINSPAWALSLDVQKRLHNNTIWKKALEVSKIVENLTQWWMHPFEAQLATPLVHYMMKNNWNLI